VCGDLNSTPGWIGAWALVFAATGRCPSSHDLPARLFRSHPAVPVACRLPPAARLPPAELAQDCYAAGATIDQVRGCVRHLVVFAGYGPCLAATLALHKARLLPEDTPAKVGRRVEGVRGSVGGRWLLARVTGVSGGVGGMQAACNAARQACVAVCSCLGLMSGPNVWT